MVGVVPAGEPTNDDSAGDGLLFCLHTDIWTPDDTWTRDPYDPIIKDGRLYGAGPTT